MQKVVTFGELLLKLSPHNYQRILQTDSFNVEYSGAEVNVAVSLANFGVPVSFVSKVPNQEIGASAINTVRSYGIITDNIKHGEGRLGIYFSEKGASQRPSKVIYDRHYSAFSESTSSDYDWDSIFEDAGWFHFSGITPALSDSLAAICMEACKRAKEKGLTVSCDLNYRSKLWSREKAGSVMKGLAPYVDVCISNESDIPDVFGIKAAYTDEEYESVDDIAYSVVAKELTEKYGFKAVAITLRQSISASDNIWSAILFDGKTTYYGKKYSIHIVDRIGGGDSFSAGLIYGFINKKEPQHTLDFAVAASCLKHSIEGDFNMVTVEEVEALLKGHGSGRIQR